MTLQQMDVGTISVIRIIRINNGFQIDCLSVGESACNMSLDKIYDSGFIWVFLITRLRSLYILLALVTLIFYI